jgi:hypothetical protein
MIRRLALLLSFLACAMFGASCGKPGPGNVLVLTLAPDGSMLDGGLPQAMTIPGTDSWESSPWSADDGGVPVSWLPYGPHVQLDVQHGLGRMPTAVITYISFTQNGFDPSQAAGDLARLVEVTPDHVTVWNDTNGSYFARIVVF